MTSIAVEQAEIARLECEAAETKREIVLLYEAQVETYQAAAAE